jgi:hypothetical protein
VDNKKNNDFRDTQDSDLKDYQDPEDVREYEFSE